MSSMIRVGVIALATVVCLVSSAEASHYRLADVEFISEDARAVFERFGYQDTADVLANVASPERRLALHEASGIAMPELEELAAICELIQVAGVGPRAASLLRHAGVAGVQGLGTSDPVALTAALEEAQRETGLTSIAPPLETVQGWIASAASVPIVVTY